MSILVLFVSLACVSDSKLEPTPTPGTDCDTADPVWADQDGDGAGTGTPVADCGTAGMATTDGDCDDQDAAVSPFATEACNGVDDDCDGEIDDDLFVLTWYDDTDGDGFGGAEHSGCEAPAASVDVGGDCDDTVATVYPGAPETCDSLDQDCDGEVDEDATDASTWYLDGDEDGYGVADLSVIACTAPAGFAANPDDCDDEDATRNLDCAAPPPESAVECGGTIYSWASTTTVEPELHLMGAYEPDGGRGAITVDIERATTMTLHLSAYTATEWTVNNTGGATIEAILVSGYDAQVVNAPAGVPVEIRTAATTGSSFGYYCGYSLPYNNGGCDTDLLIAGVEAYTGLTMSSFAGCYNTTAFRLR